MARDVGLNCRRCRRAGEKLYLKAERCYTPKCAMERRAYPPGEHGKEGQFRRRRPSDYALQKAEKQKARRIYGVLERQFRRYFEEALRRPGMTGANLVVILETRLDNAIYRLGLAGSRDQARQLVQHGHFLINGRRTNTPSLLLKPNDRISVRPGSRRTEYFKTVVQDLGQRAVPSWLSLDADDWSARVVAAPAREEIDVALNEQLIVEYYSR